jgi:DNA polymerase III sliding clamp (beta) subunit (PCNA family)
VNVDITDKKLFVSSFLQPISKISDSCVIRLTDNGFSCLTCTSDSTVILHNEYKADIDIDGELTLNISDIKKIIKAIECIQSDKFQLAIDKNNISYTGRDIKFKYHLLEDGIITVPKLNIEKIESLEFPVVFTVQYKSLLELIRGSTFAAETNKLYLHAENDQIMGDLTDRSRNNVDSISIPLCDYAGTNFNNIVLNFEIIRIISGVRVKQLECKINPKVGVVLFQIIDNSIKTRYISSSLIK